MRTLTIRSSFLFAIAALGCQEPSATAPAVATRPSQVEQTERPAAAARPERVVPGTTTTTTTGATAFGPTPLGGPAATGVQVQGPVIDRPGDGDLAGGTTAPTTGGVTDPSRSTTPGATGTATTGVPTTTVPSAIPSGSGSATGPGF
jgi:hypothetical protein